MIVSEKLGAEKIKYGYKPQAGNEMLYRNKRHGTGERGDGHPCKVNEDGNGDRVAKHLAVEAAFINDFKKEQNH